MIKLKEVIILFSVFLTIIQSVSAISNVQHSVDGNKVTLTYQGIPPFWINIRGDTNIGQAGGYLWAKTYSKSFSYDMSFAINPSKKFYYGIKDTSWSSPTVFNLGEVQKNGLIIINKNADGKNYAKQIAQNRGWGFIELESSDINYIKNTVKSFYNENNNEFLLIIGDFNEIPLKDTGTQQFGSQVYITDPQLYGDINGDGYVDLSIGRIPFSSKILLEKYFDNLQISGENVYIENYPFGSSYDNLPYDGSTSGEYIASFCLKKELPQLQPYRFRSKNQLINDYRSSSVVLLNTHGSWSGFSVKTEEEFRNKQTHSLGINDLCGTQQEDCFTNRPIFLHFSCLNARKLGIDLIKRGASAFIGNYNTGGYTPKGFLSELATGKPVGTVMKNQINRKLSHNLALKMIVENRGERENVNIINENIEIFDDYGAIMYGDPTLTVNIQKGSENVNILEDHNNKVVTIKINKNPEFILDPEHGEDYYGILCYNSVNLDSLKHIDKSSWEQTFNSSHMATFLIPINDNSIQEITSVKIKLEDQYETIYDNSINYYLFKGIDKQFLYLDLGYDSPFIPSNKDLEIQIYYN
ncbi:MAG: hypothetical protein J7J92_00680 [Candidatus Aenigmarchaeota archaeon]|nr:hypothetical protein [Candidatus Aenigmarchaeota archaeon]